MIELTPTLIAYLIEGLTTSDEAKSFRDKFQYMHGPFNSKNDVYRWLHEIIGDKSLYFGYGLQKNVLKGGGGDQSAWYGFIDRTPTGVYFYGKKQYPYTPPPQPKMQPEGYPLDYSDILKLMEQNTDSDTIYGLCSERGITNRLYSVLSHPQHPKYKRLDETLAGLLADLFGIQQDKPPKKLNIGRYGVNIDDFMAVGDQDDHTLADIFGIQPAQANILRMELLASPEELEFIKTIEQASLNGESDEYIAVNLGVPLARIQKITRPYRAQRIEALYKAKTNPTKIANMLQMPLKVVMRIINSYDARQQNMPYCKLHKRSYSTKFGCPDCNIQI